MDRRLFDLEKNGDFKKELLDEDRLQILPHFREHALDLAEVPKVVEGLHIAAASLTLKKPLHALNDAIDIFLELLFVGGIHCFK